MHGQAIAVGRLVPVKNFDVIVDAWTDVAIPLQIVGNGPEFAKLKNQIQRLGLEEKVELLGSRSDVSDLMAKSDLLVVASTREGFSYVVLEALRAKLIVISSNTGIAADLVPPDFLIDPLSPSNVAQLVNKTMASLEASSRRFDSAWKSARQLTVEQMIRQTEDVYLELLGRSRL